MVLYEGKAIAFGPSEEMFARVRTASGQAAAGTTNLRQRRQARKRLRRAPHCAESVPVMRPGDRCRNMTTGARAAIGRASRAATAVGPQGAALILELQRLRQAFELERRRRRACRAGASSGARRRASGRRASECVSRSGSRKARWGGPSMSALSNSDFTLRPAARSDATNPQHDRETPRSRRARVEREP